MIIDVDTQTGKAITYNDSMAFIFAHNDELSEYYKKIYKPKLEVNIDHNFLDRLSDMLPCGTSKIIRIHEHTNYIVVNCEEGEVYSFDRTGEYPYFKLHSVKMYKS